MTPNADESWLPVVGSADYEVSDLGRVRNRGTGRVLETPLAGAGGYAAVSIERRRKKSTLAYVHHLVAEAFLGRRLRGHFIGFKDNNPTNAAATNLEYRTADEHGRHAAGRKMLPAVKAIAAKLTPRGRELADAVVPAIAARSRTWPDFGISYVRCADLPGYTELLTKLARWELATLVRYCLYLEGSGASWIVLSSPVYGPTKK